MNQSEGKLLTVLTRAAERKIGDFKLRDLFNTTWALGRSNQSDEKLFTALLSAAERRGNELKPQELVNTAWVIATVN